MDDFQNSDDESFIQNNYRFSLKDIDPKISPIAAGFIGLFGGFILYQFVGGLLTILVFGMDLGKAPVGGVRLITVAGQMLFILLPALLFTKMFYEDVTNVIRFNIPKVRELFIFTLGIILLTPLLQYFMEIQNFYLDQWALNYEAFRTIKEIFDSTNKLLEETYLGLMRVDSVFEGIFVVGIIAVVPAVCEEVMFRGFIQRSFEFKLKPVYAALITAIFFGIFHFNPYGLIPLIGLGFYFGFAAYTSNSIFVPMFLHFLNNLFAVLVFFVIGEDDMLSNTAAVSGKELNSALIVFFTLLALFIGFIFYVKYYYNKQKNSGGLNANLP